MDYSVGIETFSSLASSWVNLLPRSRANSVFLLPSWLEAWWRELGPPEGVLLAVVRRADKLLGIAPLQRQEGVVSFLGDEEVRDYADFVIAPGEEECFFAAIVEHLSQRGLRCLTLQPVRPDSLVMLNLVPLARTQGHKVTCQVIDVAPQLELPASWDAYFELLDRKDRHELRRKLRRLDQAGEVRFSFVTSGEEMPSALDTFMRLFRLSRPDKADFLTSRKEAFFRSLAMADEGYLRLALLELNHRPLAAVMCFDYGQTTYLYNNGYDPEYASLSLGIVSKALCIKDSIEREQKRFDFLRGAEVYKYHLGGKDMPLYRCEICLK